MNSTRFRQRCALVLAILAAFPLAVVGANNPKKKAAKQQAPGLKFRVQQLHVDNNEGCDVADFNKDGFKWDPQTMTFSKYAIAENGPGIGLQIRFADLNGDKWKDIVVAGKSGTHVLWNLGK